MFEKNICLFVLFVTVVPFEIYRPIRSRRFGHVLSDIFVIPNETLSFFNKRANFRNVYRLSTIHGRLSIFVDRVVYVRRPPPFVDVIRRGLNDSLIIHGTALIPSEWTE